MEKVNRRKNSKNLHSNEDKIAVLLAAINVLCTKNTDYRKVGEKLDSVMLDCERKNISITANIISKILDARR